MNNKEHLKSILASLNIIFMLIDDPTLEINDMIDEIEGIVKDTLISAHKSISDNGLHPSIKGLYADILQNQYKFEKLFPGMTQEVLTSLKNNVDIQE